MINKIKESYLAELEAIKENMDQAFHLIEVNEELEGILGGISHNPGKMIRPLLMLLVAGDCKGNEKKELLATAASMEMIHNSSLVLDDMLDKAALRRGEPTVSAKFGDPVALCVGEYILAASYRYLQGLGYHESALEVVDITQRACNGEMVQNMNRGNVSVTIDAYLEAIRGKTAALFSVICESACRITHRDAKVKEKMGRLGEMIGIVFQLRDDLLDWTAAEDNIGKPVNKDFSEGIYTLPAIHAFKSPDIGGKLRTIAKKDRLQPGDLTEARKLIHESGGIEFTIKYIKEETNKARQLLEWLPDQANRQAMEEIISVLQKG